ncbi:hypothetical protein B0H14DRAFT_3616491 [Mycena olivaceomarginata]|nr:hypothetical protein B0H14DRAFT_3616491 [Mycena olivaceomarginata]
MRSLKRAQSETQLQTVQYAVRGELAIKAETYRDQLKSGGHNLPFDKQKGLDQPPITFTRQVAALTEWPALAELAPGVFPADVIARAKELQDEIGTIGAYSHSQGVPFIRKSVARFIEEARARVDSGTRGNSDGRRYAWRANASCCSAYNLVSFFGRRASDIVMETRRVVFPAADAHIMIASSHRTCVQAGDATPAWPHDLHRVHRGGIAALSGMHPTSSFCILRCVELNLRAYTDGIAMASSFPRVLYDVGRRIGAGDRGSVLLSSPETPTPPPRTTSSSPPAASAGVSLLINMLITAPTDGVLIPIPQYPFFCFSYSLRFLVSSRSRLEIV